MILKVAGVIVVMPFLAIAVVVFFGAASGILALTWLIKRFDG